MKRLSLYDYSKLKTMRTTRQKYLMSFLIVMSIISVEAVSAQIIEFSGFAGYQLGGTLKGYYGEVKMDNAMSYGGNMALALSTTTFVEFSYIRSDTEGQFRDYNDGSIGDKVPLSSNYIQLGALQEMDFGILSPFFTIKGGLAVWSPKNSVDFNSYTQFAFSVGGGTKIWISDMIGIRLQANMLMPLVWRGGGFGCGFYTGGSSCGGAVYTRITPFQGEFSGGLIIKIRM